MNEGVNATLNTGWADVAFASGLSGQGNITKTGSSALNVNAGSSLFTGTLRIAQGTLKLGVTGALTTNKLDVADAGVLSFGTQTLAKIGALQGSGNVALTNESSAGVTLVLGNTGLNSDYSGVLSGSGGVRINGGTITLSGANTYSGGTAVYGGALVVGNGAAAGTLGSGPVTNNTSITFNRSDAAPPVANVISGTGSLTQAGTGTLTLTGNNTYTGTTTVAAGTLALNGSLAAGSTVTVGSGATLTGTGTVYGSVTLASGSTLRPTGGLGVLRTGNLSLPAGSTLAVAINGNTLSTQYGQVSVTGTVNLTGSTLMLTGTRGNDDSQSMIILANDSTDAIVGTFAGLAQGATVTLNGVDYTLLYTGGDGNDVVLIDRAMSASISGPSSCNEGDVLAFTSTVTNTPDTLSYAWSVNKDQAVLIPPANPSQTAQGFSFTVPDDGIYDVIVQVGDTHGHITSATQPVTAVDVPPSLSLSGNASVGEGASYLLQLGAIVDPGGNKVTQYRVNWGDGAYTVYSSAEVAAAARYVSHTYADNSATQRVITVDLMDEDGPTETGGWHIARGTLLVAVNNVAPTATISNAGPANEGSAVTVSFSGGTDPSSADMAAGLHYSLATSTGGLATTYAAAGTTTSSPFTFTDNGSYTVYGRIFDKDGGSRDYTTSITVNNVAPTATLSNAGPANEGSAITVSFSGGTDPSSADMAAGLRYSFATSTGGLATTYAAAGTTTSSSFTFTDSGIYTVYGRVVDKDPSKNYFVNWPMCCSLPSTPRKEISDDGHGMVGSGV